MMCSNGLNSITVDKVSDVYIFKVLTEGHKKNNSETLRLYSQMEKDIVEKGENAGYHGDFFKVLSLKVRKDRVSSCKMVKVLLYFSLRKPTNILIDRVNDLSKVVLGSLTVHSIGNLCN